MNKRQKEWNEKVNEGIQQYHTQTDETYGYYIKLNKRNRIKQTKGLGYWVHLGVRVLLFIVLMFMTIKSYMN